MYRLSGAKDVVSQRVVTNELMVGLLNVFNAEDSSDLKIDEWGLDILNDIFLSFSNNSSLHDLDRNTLRVIADKIEKMYMELRDQEYEYTYDEFGGYLLYLFMLYLGEGEGNIDDDYRSDQLIASSLYIEDEQYLIELFGSMYDNSLEDLLSDKEMKEFCHEYSQKVSKEMYITIMKLKASCFPYMGFHNPNTYYEDIAEYFTDDSFIFWDTDYLFYDKEGGANIFLQNIGMGFVSDSDEREPVSGSIKIQIER